MRFKSLFLALALSLFSGIMAFSQKGTVTGRVTDKTTHEAIPGSSVTLLRRGIQYKETLTDTGGNFTITPDTSLYDLKITYVGYRPYLLKNIRVETGKTLTYTIEMKESPVMLSEVEVVDYKAPLISKDVAFSSATVTSEDIVKIDGESSVSDASFIPRFAESLPGEGILTAGEINDFSKWNLWEDLSFNALNQWQKHWQITPEDRFTFQVINNNGKPVVDALIRISSSNLKDEFTTHTDNTGKAELWGNLFSGKRSRNYSAKVSYKGKEYPIYKVMPFQKGINVVELPVPCEIPSSVDILYVVDATGSMKDELEFLKAEMKGIITGVKTANPQLDINLGCLFYRDKEDVYIVRKKEFTPDLSTIVDFISQQNADGGGDTPEAVDQALDTAINSMKWSEKAVARLLFLILDAPPHYTPDILQSLKNNLVRAASKGIFIIPITGSGIEKSTEYLMRAMALATNGRYVFLTDHSHVGETHLIPTTDEYDVMLLNKLIMNLISQYLYTPPCDQDSSLVRKTGDTVYVFNPKLIDHVVADSSLLNKHRRGTGSDTNYIAFKDSLKMITPADRNNDSLQHLSDTVYKKQEEKFRGFKYYPNPTSGILNIEIDGEMKELFLSDLSGKLLKRYQLTKEMKKRIDLGNFPSGIYFLQCWIDNKRVQGKVVLVH